MKCCRQPTMSADKMRRILLPLFLLLLSQEATAAQGSANAADSLKSHFAAGIVYQGARAELRHIGSIPADMPATIRWHLPSLAGHPGRFSMLAESTSKGHVRRWYVPVQVRWWAKAVSARSNIPARSLLFRDMLQIKSVDITGHRGHWWEDPKPLVGMRLIRPLKAGEAVLSVDVKQPPMIRRGDHVSITLKRGRLLVRAEGKAMRSAGRGERILVRNLSSSQVIQAIVEQPGIVRALAGETRGHEG